MFRVSNTVVGVLNIISTLAGLAAIVFGVYIQFHGGGATDCQKVLRTPLLVVGFAFVVVSLLGVIGTFGRNNAALYIYLFVMFVLILGLLVFTVFGLLVTNKAVGKSVSGKGFHEIRVTDFSHFLQRYVSKEKNWNQIKSCLKDSSICHIEGINYGDTDSVLKSFEKLSPTENGCCKPPAYCGFTAKNATYWEAPKAGPAADDMECRTWKNDQKELCYDCKSCKAGMLVSIRRQWRNLAIFNACLTGFVTLIYIVGCCATKNNRSDHYNKMKPKTQP